MRTLYKFVFVLPLALGIDAQTPQTSVTAPASWSLQLWDGSAWTKVDAATPYTTDRDKFNMVHFASVHTTALRLQVPVQPRQSVGILQWRVSE